MTIRRYTVAEALTTVLQLKSQRAAAKFIGVNARTLERWLSGSIKPSVSSQEKIRAAASKTRKELKKLAKRDDYSPLEAPVPVYGVRRRLKQYNKKGKPTGKDYPSDWTNYRVDRLNFDQTLAVLIAIQKQKSAY